MAGPYTVKHLLQFCHMRFHLVVTDLFCQAPYWLR
jgi:hypothetical protein